MDYQYKMCGISVCGCVCTHPGLGRYGLGGTERCTGHSCLQFRRPCLSTGEEDDEARLDVDGE